MVRKIIGAAMNVHEVLGYGFDFETYKNALKVELELRSLSFQEDIFIDVFYKGKLVGSQEVDLLVGKSVAIKIIVYKTIDEHIVKQAQKMMSVCNVPSGLLLNFGQSKLKFTELV